MYRVLVFGTGKSCDLVRELLNNDVEIIGYIDNDSSKFGNIHYGKKIINPDEICGYKYDFIIIASQYNEEIYEQLMKMNIDKNIILQYYKLTDNYENYCKRLINNYLEDKYNSTEVLVTGISYAFKGFIELYCLKEAYSFAAGSQDLYYDYNIMKYLFDNHKFKMEKIKKIIIGISYYSFQYDMSLSSIKSRTLLYYEAIGKCHNFKEIEKVYEEYRINRNIADLICKKHIDGNYEFAWNIINIKSFEEKSFEEKQIIGKKQAELDCNKDYPKTVKENIQILKDYIMLLKENNINPVIVVFPASKYYYNNFSTRIENEFKNIIKNLKCEFKFQYIDYFRSNIFEDCDFEDVSHLNIKGAEKFTKILNNEIEW
ncbi:nucleoside-diphosphate sugar epimerase/dehydratase [Clostridium beijerinckii]|uniref:C2185-like N-terminal domain-containing protein n=1 Tax=Clostridium beijerinckii TaxID=1520 RepID=A0A1S8S655_CLOBE|nr:chemotaxis protein [Clostridium beijerinckii]NRY60048.1 hypothetical protein [Clostridium beijerinckii]OOM60904.1 hypothetical protein CLBCK_26210 [Clostridium beijerinckii]